MDEILRHTDLAHAIQLARANKMSEREIVRALTPLLGISVSEFLEFRRNR